MHWFRSITLNQVVVMGRNTWASESMPSPLPNRENVIFSSKLENINALKTQVVSGDVCEILKNLSYQYFDKNICVIGGASLLMQALPMTEIAYITKIPGEYQCDVTIDLDKYLSNFKLISCINKPTCTIETYKRVS